LQVAAVVLALQFQAQIMVDQARLVEFLILQAVYEQQPIMRL
jgi:hypothetical protein